MSSFFYTTKHAKRSTHALPSTISQNDVLDVFQNHSAFARVLWPPTPSSSPTPHSAQGQRQTEGCIKISEETGQSHTTTYFRVGPTAGSGPGPGSGTGSSAASCKASISTSSRADVKEAVVKEDIPLGLEVSVIYRVSTRDEILERDNSTNEDSLAETSVSDLYLEVERSVQAPRPLSFLVKMKDGPVLKTRNLLFVLEEMGRNGGDVEGAVERLWMRGMEEHEDEVDIGLKNKAD
ncbi:hypothetical protein BDV18DRAFT_158087 [Aspergillus unguis]